MNNIDPTDLFLVQTAWSVFQELHKLYLLGGKDYQNHRELASQVERADRSLQEIMDGFCAKYQMSEEQLEALLSTPT